MFLNKVRKGDVVVNKMNSQLGLVICAHKTDVYVLVDDSPYYYQHFYYTHKEFEEKYEVIDHDENLLISPADCLKKGCKLRLRDQPNVTGIFKGEMEKGFDPKVSVDIEGIADVSRRASEYELVEETTEAQPKSLGDNPTTKETLLAFGFKCYEYPNDKFGVFFTMDHKDESGANCTVRHGFKKGTSFNKVLHALMNAAYEEGLKDGVRDNQKDIRKVFDKLFEALIGRDSKFPIFMYGPCF